MISSNLKSNLKLIGGFKWNVNQPLVGDIICEQFRKPMKSFLTHDE